MKCKTCVEMCPGGVSRHVHRTHFGHSIHTSIALDLHFADTRIALPRLSIRTSRTLFRIRIALPPHSARASPHFART
jgi:NAD-dependent dihydropyrimidine dehydrogenase PreA subunit